MEPDAVVATLRSLVAEGSGDVALFEALSRRFLASAEEYFPPQIDAVVGLFAELGYADEALLHGLVGRCGDVVADASPRRVVRLLRHGAGLRLAPAGWLEELLEQLHRHLPNLREGIPSALGSLRQLGRRDAELAELLLTQGLLNRDELGPHFFTRVFERWSLHGCRHAEAEECAAAIAADPGALHDARDGLNLLAGLWRCGIRDAAAALEDHLVSQLEQANSAEAAAALAWMRRLALRSTRLWAVGAEAVELGFQNRAFVRDDLPGALLSLASLGAGVAGRQADAGGQDAGREAELVAKLIGAPELREALPRYSAPQTLEVFSAACMLTAACEEGSSLEAQVARSMPWDALSAQMARLSRQLSLPERRQLLAAVGPAEDLSRRLGLNADQRLKAQVDSQRLPVVALPPLPPFVEDEVAAGVLATPAPDTLAQGSFEALWSHHTGDQGVGERERGGVRYFGPRDILVGRDGPGSVAPQCGLLARALELRGWHVTLRA